VLLSRMTPPAEARDVAPHWNEARHATGLLGLDLQAFFDQAVQKLPDPKSWAAEEAALAKAEALANAHAPAKTPAFPPPPRQEIRGARPRKRKASAPPPVQTGSAAGAELAAGGSLVLAPELQ
jgi:hypothetical protein